MSTEIQWTWTFNLDGTVLSKGDTWNFLSGCDKVSPACKFCYAETLHNQRHKAYHEGHALPPQYAQPFSRLQFHQDRLQKPLSWQTGRRIFVNSMSDTFHKDVPVWILAEAFATMAAARRHTFLVLTKRIENACNVLSSQEFREGVASIIRNRLAHVWGSDLHALADDIDSGKAWPLPNVWIGASVESQPFAEQRIPILLKTPAAVRFLSCEPLLGYLDISKWLPQQIGDGEGGVTPFKTLGIDWVIVGGESGKEARIMDPDDLRALRDQCLAANVPFFFKQWGEWTTGENVDDNSERGGKYPTRIQVDENKWSDCSDDWITEADNGPIMYRTGKKKAGRMLDGVEWNQYPKEKV